VQSFGDSRGFFIITKPAIAAFFRPEGGIGAEFLELPKNREAANEALFARLRGLAAAARLLWRSARVVSLNANS
jgi:hypothetical protein